MVSHITSKPPFYRLEFVLEGVSFNQLCIIFLCPYQGCKNHKGWHLLAEPSPWDWFALPQMIHNLDLVRLWAGGERNNSYDEENNFLPSQFLIHLCLYYLLNVCFWWHSHPDSCSLNLKKAFPSMILLGDFVDELSLGKVVLWDVCPSSLPETVWSGLTSSLPWGLLFSFCLKPPCTGVMGVMYIHSLSCTGGCQYIPFP